MNDEKQPYRRRSYSVTRNPFNSGWSDNAKEINEREQDKDQQKKTDMDWMKFSVIPSGRRASIPSS